MRRICARGCSQSCAGTRINRVLRLDLGMLIARVSIVDTLYGQSRDTVSES